MDQEMTEIHVPIENKGCIQCHNPDILPGYPNNFCRECRQKLIQFPIPIWVKGVGAMVMFLLIVSFVINQHTYRLHRSVNEVVKCFEQKKYVTASAAIRKALAIDSSNVRVHAMSFICNYYNGENEAMLKDYAWLAAKEAKEDDVPLGTFDVATYVLQTFPDDTLTSLLMRIDSLSQNKTGELEKYVLAYPDKTSGKYYLANEYFETDRFDACDSLLNIIIDQSPGNISFLCLKVATLRSLKQYRRADSICDRMLADNKESYPAFVMKAKISCFENKPENAQYFLNQAKKFNQDSEKDISYIAAELQLLKTEYKSEEYNKLLAQTMTRFKDSKPELEYIKLAITKFN